MCVAIPAACNYLIATSERAGSILFFAYGKNRAFPLDCVFTPPPPPPLRGLAIPLDCVFTPPRGLAIPYIGSELYTWKAKFSQLCNPQVKLNMAEIEDIPGHHSQSPRTHGLV